MKVFLKVKQTWKDMNFNLYFWVNCPHCKHPRVLLTLRLILLFIPQYLWQDKQSHIVKTKCMCFTLGIEITVIQPQYKHFLRQIEVNGSLYISLLQFDYSLQPFSLHYYYETTKFSCSQCINRDKRLIASRETQICLWDIHLCSLPHF